MIADDFAAIKVELERIQKEKAEQVAGKSEEPEVVHWWMNIPDFDGA